MSTTQTAILLVILAVITLLRLRSPYKTVAENCAFNSVPGGIFKAADRSSPA